jgi:hypothetical protein
MAIPKINDVCINNASDNQAILQLFDDKCFKIVEKEKTSGEFCLPDFAFPVDGYSCINLGAEVDNGEIILFDNQILTAGSPVLDLTSGAVFVRGIMLKVIYPIKDDNGEEIDIVNKSVELWIEDAETLAYKKHPLYNLFALFTNPKSNDPKDLINRIKIINPNLLYTVKISALIIYGKVK